MEQTTSHPLSGLEAAVYLRKSRAEEGMATDEVLERHRTTLYDFAAANGIHIVEAYPEVVSGESLYARPEMLRLLQDVEDGKYDAVLCMDLDRLSRGRMKDQGIVLDAFRESATLIVTPEKTYDLSDELDEEYAELKTFISRREYKIINKRLRRGLKQTIQDGCYVANAPYGYRNVVINRKPTLEIYEPEAKYVRMIYEMYLQGYGCQTIAHHINALGAKPHRSEAFSRNSIRHILRNPTFCGKIVWDQKTHIRKGAKGNPKHITIYNPREKWTIVEGIHPGIIDQETYDKAQAILEKRYQPAKNDGTVRSPLAGLIKCANCGRNMQRLRMKGMYYLGCVQRGCCAGARYDYVEDEILSTLEETMNRLIERPEQTTAVDNSVLETALDAVSKDLAATDRQKSRLYELLEMGEYDLELFRERMGAVKEKRSALEHRRQELQRELEAHQAMVPSAFAEEIRSVLDAYQDADIPHRNAMLKSLIKCIWYKKEKKTKPSEFYLTYVFQSSI